MTAITFGTHEESLPAFLLRGISAVRNGRRKLATLTLAILPPIGLLWLSHYIGGLPAATFSPVNLSGADIQRETLVLVGALIWLYLTVLPAAWMIRDTISGVLLVLCTVTERCIAYLSRG